MVFSDSHFFTLLYCIPQNLSEPFLLLLANIDPEPCGMV